MTPHELTTGEHVTGWIFIGIVLFIMWLIKLAISNVTNDRGGGHPGPGMW